MNIKRKDFQIYGASFLFILMISLIIFLKPRNEDLFNLLYPIILGFTFGLGIGLKMKFKGE